MARGDVEQVRGTLALLPEGGAFPRALAGQEQGAGGRLAEARREQRRGRELTDDELLDLVGVDEQLLDGDLLDGLGEAHHDPVVAPEDLDLEVEPIGEAGLERERPRRVHPRTERREHADPPVADLVGEALDDDGAIVGEHPGGLGLLGEVLQQVAGRAIVEAGVVVEAGTGRRLGRRVQLAHDAAEGAPQLERATGLVAVPERCTGRLAGAGVTVTRS